MTPVLKVTWLHTRRPIRLTIRPTTRWTIWSADSTRSDRFGIPTDCVRIKNAQTHRQGKRQSEQTAHPRRRGLRNVDRTGNVHQAHREAGYEAADEQRSHVLRIADRQPAGQHRNGGEHQGELATERLDRFARNQAADQRCQSLQVCDSVFNDLQSTDFHARLSTAYHYGAQPRLLVRIQVYPAGIFLKPVEGR